MTDKELRKAKKDELIEMLYYLRTEADELKAENDRLRSGEVGAEPPADGAGDADA